MEQLNQITSKLFSKSFYKEASRNQDLKSSNQARTSNVPLAKQDGFLHRDFLTLNLNFPTKPSFFVGFPYLKQQRKEPYIIVNVTEIVTVTFVPALGF